MSNQDEDEVEDELEEMERQLVGVDVMPDAPTRTVIREGSLPDTPKNELEQQEQRERKQKERARARRAALEAV